ncbi:hypothetical protein [Magnetospirillum moscoviense]|uniref:Uncharacterized protein n=1 Tax=Magnetospirillum moscoviense TaxID=1437059 RepID=A0A178MIU9_9PROT|nr:hypothetical protein [Magnetospirillum moscoviense]OAN48651.1 hypothetical protein A6A05_14975 [Magnetospirillum moscoviense]
MSKESGEIQVAAADGGASVDVTSERVFNRYFALAGLALIGISVCGLLSLGWVFLHLYDQSMHIIKDATGMQILLYIVQVYSDSIIIFLASAFAAFVGMKLLNVAGASARSVIPRRDYLVLADAIRDANRDAITEYIRLSALTGITGFFTKLGLSGLPLATIGLTLVFSAVSLYDDKFMDLAKLTLGAFIGSFVQRGVASQGAERTEPRSPAETGG